MQSVYIHLQIQGGGYIIIYISTTVLENLYFFIFHLVIDIPPTTGGYKCLCISWQHVYTYIHI